MKTRGAMSDTYVIGGHSIRLLIGVEGAVGSNPARTPKFLRHSVEFSTDVFYNNENGPGESSFSCTSEKDLGFEYPLSRRHHGLVWVGEL